MCPSIGYSIEECETGRRNSRTLATIARLVGVGKLGWRVGVLRPELRQCWQVRAEAQLRVTSF